MSYLICKNGITDTMLHNWENFFYLSYAKEHPRVVPDTMETRDSTAPWLCMQVLAV